MKEIEPQKHFSLPNLGEVGIMDNMKTQDDDAEKAELAAKLAAAKLFNAIQAHLFGPDRFDLSYLAREAIVTAYEEGLEYAYKACFQIVKDETGKCK